MSCLADRDLTNQDRLIAITNNCTFLVAVRYMSKGFFPFLILWFSAGWTRQERLQLCKLSRLQWWQKSIVFSAWNSTTNQLIRKRGSMGEAHLLLTASAQGHPVTSAHILLVRPSHMASTSRCKELKPKLSCVPRKRKYTGWISARGTALQMESSFE